MEQPPNSVNREGHPRSLCEGLAARCGHEENFSPGGLRSMPRILFIDDEIQAQRPAKRAFARDGRIDYRDSAQGNHDGECSRPYNARKTDLQYVSKHAGGARLQV